MNKITKFVCSKNKDDTLKHILSIALDMVEKNEERYKNSDYLLNPGKYFDHPFIIALKRIFFPVAYKCSFLYLAISINSENEFAKILEKNKIGFLHSHKSDSDVGMFLPFITWSHANIII